MNAADIVIDVVQRVDFGPQTRFRNLGLLALSTTDEREADCLTLDEALERHSAHIVEISEGGHVPELKTDGRFDGAGALGAALVTSDRAIHVSEFRVESAGTRNRNKGIQDTPRTYAAA